ncbi:formyltransferase family protein, partial [Enhygromyxa salina]|uniref:formyltransferase family protein n=1 Tax=Enhygromyxa salina TaxID=215803 RepID=UPI0023E3E14C
MKPSPFRCVVIGEQALLVECTRLLLARGHEVVALVSPEAELRRWAEGQGLRAVPFSRELATELAELRFDYLFSIANLRILPAELLGLPKRLPINFHDGPLPRHAGLFATSWAILAGESEHGVSWHVMSEEADVGDILVQRRVAMAPGITAHELDVACFDAGIESFSELVEQLAAGTATRHPQRLELRSYHGKYDGPPRGGLLSWRAPAAELDALVRATSFGSRRPNSFGLTLVALDEDASELLVVEAAQLAAATADAAPGAVVEQGAEGLRIAALDGDLRITALRDLSGAAVE